MIILPAIDLRGGKAVRLLRGEYDNMTVYAENPVSVAVSFAEKGAKNLHVVDLDGALSGNTDNFDLGTAAAENPAFAEQMAKKFGAHIAVGADIKDGEIATHGWTKKTGTSAETFFRMMEDMGVQTVICTDVSRDGALMGTNMELYRNLSEKFKINIIASGGITALDEVFELAGMKLFGAILGKAIYNGNIDLAEAVKAEKI